MVTHMETTNTTTDTNTTTTTITVDANELRTLLAALDAAADDLGAMIDRCTDNPTRSSVILAGTATVRLTNLNGLRNKVRQA